MIHKFSLPDGWLPTNKDDLRKTIEGFLDKAKSDIKDKVRGLVVPHAGYRFSGPTAAYAYKTLKGQSDKRVFVIGPSHSVRFDGVSVTKATHYETPLGEVPVDTTVCRELLQHKYFDHIPETEEGEHSVEIQMPFLQMVLKDFKIVPITVGNLTPAQMQSVAEVIQSYVNEDTLVVASSDFMHYGQRFGYVPFRENIRDNIHKMDNEGIQYIINGEVKSFLDYLERTKNTICGRKPVGLLMMILQDTVGTLLRYDTSGDLENDFSSSVSYAAIGLTDYKLTKEEGDSLLQLARQTLRSWLKDGKKPVVNADKFSEALRRPRGVFVTLKKHHRLRGCIGCGCVPDVPTYLLKPLYQGVIDYTIQSAFNDHRFTEVTAAEEPEIDIEISVLSSLKRVKGPEDIVIGKHGVWLEKGNYGAVFLPQVAPEQGWDRDTMLSELSLKAGLAADAWRDKEMKFFVFTAQVFSEKQ